MSPGETELPKGPENAPQAPENGAQNAAAQQDVAFPKPDKPTIGERRWWLLNYVGVGYLTNLAVSVVLWDSLMRGHLHPIFKTVEKGFKNVLLKSGMEAKKAEQTAYTITKMGSSPVGGHFTVMGNAYLEAHSGRITHNLNKSLDPDYKYKDVHLPEDAPDDAYPQLAKPPNHNTAKQIAMRRGLGWLVVTGAGVGLHKAGLETPLEQGTLRVVNRAINSTGSDWLKRVTQVPNGRFQRLAKLVALDMYFTIFTSAVIEMTKNTFGKARGAEKHAEPTDMPEEALSLDIPGLTDDDDAPKKHQAALKPRQKPEAAPASPMIPKENLMGARQKSDMLATEPQFSLPA